MSDHCKECGTIYGEKCKCRTQAGSECMDLLTKPDFMKRYIDRLKPLALTPKMAVESAEASFEQWDRVDTPEDCADYEMECWAADS